MEDEKIKKLAETLKSQGLAVSMYEAVEKAKSILNVKIEEDTDSEVKDRDRFSKPGYNIKKEGVSVNELMKEVGVTPEQVEAQEQEKIENLKEEVNEVKEEIKEANPENVEQIKEKIVEIKEEASEIMDERSEEAQEGSQPMDETGMGAPETKNPPKNENQEQEDRFKNEKSIDLTKIFSHKK